MSNERVLYAQGEFRSLNEETRSATFVASTENPVMTWNGPEVLRMKGARLDRYQKNPVVLDSHNRGGLDSVIGKADVKVKGRQLLATITYAKTPAGERAWELVKGEFVRAVSIGYLVNQKKVKRLADGETDGEGDSLVKGPATIAREWELLEISNVPVPADADAVRRAFYESIPTGEVMPESALSRGLNEGAQPSSAGTTPAAAPVETIKPQVRQVEELPIERAAREAEATKRALAAITPPGLEKVAQDGLVRGESFEQIRAALVKAQAERFKPVGTTEPAKVEEPQKREESKAIPAEITDDVLARAFRGMRS